MTELETKYDEEMRMYRTAGNAIKSDGRMDRFIVMHWTPPEEKEVIKRYWLAKLAEQGGRPVK